MVLGPIGAGSMGTVVAAFDPELDRKVAIKVLHARGGKQATLRREAQTLARLSHPNVVTVYDVGTIDDHTFIAMELVAVRARAELAAAGPGGAQELAELDAWLAAN